MWKLQNFTLTCFWEKIRETNIFTSFQESHQTERTEGCRCWFPCFRRNFTSSKLDWFSQCGHFRIFMSLRFYVKSIVAFSEVLNFDHLVIYKKSETLMAYFALLEWSKLISRRIMKFLHCGHIELNICKETIFIPFWFQDCEQNSKPNEDEVEILAEVIRD